jgi:transcriptional regulator with XRE-family HTH domain
MRGDRLRDLREKQGKTQDELAEQLGIASLQIYRYENGKTRPDGDTVARIAVALNTSTDYLLGLTDDPIPMGVFQSKLSVKERAIIIALRQGLNYEAIKAIVTED